MHNSDFEYISSFTPFADQEPPSSSSSSSNTHNNDGSLSSNKKNGNIKIASMELAPSNRPLKEEDTLRQSFTPQFQEEKHEHQQQQIQLAQLDNPLMLAIATSQSKNEDLGTSKEDEADNDIKWSIRSNSLFVAGGLFYLAATTWKYILFSANPDLDLDTTLNIPQRVLYEALWFMGPFVYLLNSVIDVKWAMKDQRREVRRRHLEKLLRRERQFQYLEFRELQEDSPNGEQSASHQQQLESDDSLGAIILTHSDTIQILAQTKMLPPNQLQNHQTHKNLRLQTILVHPTKKLLRRLRKHMGHRQELAAAATFGLAAFCSVVSSICGLIAANTTEWTFSIENNGGDNNIVVNGELLVIAGMLEHWSIHVYMLSAIFALWKNPFSNTMRSGMGVPSGGAADAALAVASSAETTDVILSWYQRKIVEPILNNADSLESLGDTFFGIASLVDLILEDSTMDDDILWWPIVSSWLWTLDAVLHLACHVVLLGNLLSKYYLKFSH